MNWEGCWRRGRRGPRGKQQVSVRASGAAAVALTSAIVAGLMQPRAAVANSTIALHEIANTSRPKWSVR